MRWLAQASRKHVVGQSEAGAQALAVHGGNARGDAGAVRQRRGGGIDAGALGERARGRIGGLLRVQPCAGQHQQPMRRVAGARPGGERRTREIEPVGGEQRAIRPADGQQ